ncbi:septum formation family protein, partial [Tsukamurella soli]|uniref:septum formation family protein n=1 Tax=Tsukamurella soli TaxID=644556 RepID=UPI0031EB1472
AEVLGAGVVGAVALGAVLAATGQVGAHSPFHETSGGPRAEPAASEFAASKAGDCLTWAGSDATALHTVPCSAPHKFEVAGAPAHAFDSSSYPTEAVLSATRDQQCSPVVASYLGKRLDPMGRFQVGLLTPDRAAWENGDRTARCGIEMVDGTGAPQDMTGKVSDQDQSVSWPEGTCVGISAQGAATSPVPCTEPHAFEVTAVIDMAAQFGGPDAAWPTLQAQETYLARACTTRTAAWFGSPQGLRKSDLSLQWTRLSQQSWSAGSRTVVCFVGSAKTVSGKAAAGAPVFAPLTGSAKSADLLIDGKRPTPLPPNGRRIAPPVPLPPGIAPNPQTVPAG